MRILKDFKIPNFKFPKIKMKDVENIEEVKVDYEKIKKTNESKKKGPYLPYEFKTIKEIFQRSIEEFKDKEFILQKYDHKEPFKEISYKEFGEDVIALGTAMIKYLNLKDKKVIIIGENQYDWYISYMAMLCGVGIAVPVDKEIPDNELENLIIRSEATAVIYSKKKKDSMKKIRDSLLNVEYFIEMASDDELKDKDIGINILLEMGKKIVNSGDNSFMDIEIDPEEFKVLIYTSGTTSNAKGVMICNRNLANNVNAVSAYVRLLPSDRLFSVLPLHHTYESSIGFLLPMANGCSLAVCEGLKYILDNIKEAKPTAILTVPLLVENIYKKINQSIDKSGKTGLVNSMIHVSNALKTVGVDIKRKVFKEIHDNLGGRLRIIVSAAAPIEKKVGKWLDDIGILFLQGYGLTETSPIAAVTPEYEPMIGSAGKTIICAEVKVDNPNEDGEGEILIKSETLMLGYYQDEKATKDAMTEDGFFRSGDIGYVDNNGYIYVTGRSKNVIVTQNGKNIYPEEIEILLDKIPEIKDVMVYGKEDTNEKKSNIELVITARVTLDEDEIEKVHGKKLSKEEAKKIIWAQIKEMNKQLISYKVIKELEIKDDEFEKTSTMKIKRYKELQKK